MTGDWRRHAACADAPNPDLFVSPVTRDAAKVVAGHYCAHCPVRVDCLAYAMTTGSEGVWGGHWIPVWRPDYRMRPRQPVDLLAPRAAS